MNELQASSVGYRVKDVLADRQAGQLYSVHARAAYCSLPIRPLLLIHCTEFGGIPFGIGADMEAGYLKEAGLERGMRVDISEDRLFVPAAGFGIDLSAATVWHPAECSPVEYSPSRLKANLEHALREVSRRSSGEGLGQLALFLDGLFFDETAQSARRKAQGAEGEAAQRAGELNILCRVSWEPLRRLIRAIQEHDLPAVSNSLARLIGLGIGLTPSLDDVITGLISALHRLNDRLAGGPAWVSAVGREICTLSASHTTEVSRNHLLFASSGDRFEILDDFIDSLLFSGADDLNDRIGRLVSCGATSGTELAVGVLVGVKLVLAGKRRESGHFGAGRHSGAVPA
jgi:hypothetical protein